jgi:hypothetical protein
MTSPSLPDDVGARRLRTVKYALNRWDILRWQLYVLIHNRVLVAFGLVVCLGLVWHDLGTPELAARSTGFKVFYGVLFTALMFTVLGLVTTALLFCMVLLRKYRGFLGEHELEIQADGLVERTAVNESLHRWAGFHKIVTTNRYLYIYVTDTSVHIVPRRSFASEDELRAFRGELERQINGA